MKIYSFVVPTKTIRASQALKNYPSSPYPSNIFNANEDKTGWGNGYVAIPPEHPWHSKQYENIPVEIHGGLTYSRYVDEFKDYPKEIPEGYWLIGFDTAHHGDNIKDHDELFVVLETEKLKRQLEELSKFTIVTAKLLADCTECNTQNTLDFPSYDYAPFHGSFNCTNCKQLNYYSTGD